MAFTVFTETRARTKEYISITANQTFGFPRTFLDKQKIAPDQYCIILYDDDAKEIALHFTEKGPKFALALKVPNETQGGNVLARSFFEKKGLDASKYAGRYDDFKKVTLRSLDLDKDGYAYIVKLDEHKGDNQSKKKNEVEDAENHSAHLSEIPF